ncbi:MAG: transglutaminase-like domain-containing protein [Blautia sp.]|nr:transglutaminase-like superfamily [Blautia sp.]MDY4000130.1 transglutaminase-like domain-containing protein [Blautia sp.]
MDKRNKSVKRLLFLFLLLAGIIIFKNLPYITEVDNSSSDISEWLSSAAGFFSDEPGEVKALREQEVLQTDEGHQEYYFKLLNADEQRGYREMLNGIRARKDEFYVTISDDDEVDRAYHALLKDHPELYWVHNRQQVYKTTYNGSDYCVFSPGYSYTEEEMAQIDQSIESAWQEVTGLIPEGADSYEIIKTVYTYLIDSSEYMMSDDDQSIAGIFWKKNAVCAGYAGATQYLLERLGITCIYVDGDTSDSSEGHAWNIVEIDGNYYYVDTTNGDQPQFLEGDAVQMAEHKTTIYDYLCPFPEEYEITYVPSEEFEVPECSATDRNFYILNQGCFESYDYQTIYEYCKMRLNYGAAVVRFKFSSQEAFDLAYDEWVRGNGVQDVARYYMDLYGLNEVEYHYGVLDHMKTFYFMF